MKIEFTQFQELVDLARTVKPGDTIESSEDIPEALLNAYVQNGIAKIVSSAQPTTGRTQAKANEGDDHVS